MPKKTKKTQSYSKNQKKNQCQFVIFWKPKTTKKKQCQFDEFKKLKKTKKPMLNLSFARGIGSFSVGIPKIIFMFHYAVRNNTQFNISNCRIVCNFWRPQRLRIDIKQSHPLHRLPSVLCSWQV
jgi:hypothetical protein